MKTRLSSFGGCRSWIHLWGRVEDSIAAVWLVDEAVGGLRVGRSRRKREGPLVLECCGDPVGSPVGSEWPETGDVTDGQLRGHSEDVSCRCSGWGWGLGEVLLLEGTGDVIGLESMTISTWLEGASLATPEIRAKSSHRYLLCSSWHAALPLCSRLSHVSPGDLLKARASTHALRIRGPRRLEHIIVGAHLLYGGDEREEGLYRPGDDLADMDRVVTV